MAGPIEQFEVKTLIDINIGGIDLSFTNSSAYMVVTVTLASLLLLVSTRKRALIPDRSQAASEMIYSFVLKMVRDSAGEKGMLFFPLIFALFLFILTANLIGLFPYAFSITSQIIVTFSLAALVFLTVTIYGFYKHGFHFFLLFKPEGVPAALVPIVAPIELVSYLSRPLSHSIRLFAVMLAGGISLKIFAGFIPALAALGFAGVAASVLPLAMTVALTGLKILMCAIQAYVFAMLSCMYINDALHPSH
ncbi:F0F1 ATP synthase subunit A [Aminobacter sp. NyZ550]|uniref:F0F1 ATP synthase subunit A n=1 Tax=Aminobacter sp. NyZ550 TaxID=2979870 RepID=UPI0021D5EB57|nr:F0F1 ATP synthase subunit A [Aminobacter sp. NyZ550]WAX93449.1 F0F1 ATP synthase subunit A [Aminobacter sp. NyZ550]